MIIGMTSTLPAWAREHQDPRDGLAAIAEVLDTLLAKPDLRTEHRIELEDAERGNVSLWDWLRAAIDQAGSGHPVSCPACGGEAAVEKMRLGGEPDDPIIVPCNFPLCDRGYLNYWARP